jgi:NAD(P)-dependent dehydrogenase (short-subunit alcohol dehydrogenase family)
MSHALAHLPLLCQANTGIGLETTRVIGKNGGTVVMACRTPARCELGKAKIEAEVKAGGGELKCMELDLGSLASVDSFVAAFLATGLKLTYLVNNAGIMLLPTYQTTEEGVEKQWGTNHLGHFQLTVGLLGKLKQTGPGASVPLIAPCNVVCQPATSFANQTATSFANLPLFSPTCKRCLQT